MASALMKNPYVGPALSVQITHRFGPRMPEWFMAGHTALFGIVLLIAPGLFLLPSWGGFRELFPWAPAASVQSSMGVLMLVAGIARLIGLIINGARKHVTPRIRQVSAGVGCLIWFGITYGFASSDVVSTWLAIYPLFGICELVNIHRAAHDEGKRGMEDLTKLVGSLPMPALIVGVRYLGLLQGQASPGGADTKAQVAAVIVDPTALTAAAAEVAGLAVAVTEASVTAQAHTAATDRLTRKVDELAEGVDKLRDQLVYVAAKLK